MSSQSLKSCVYCRQHMDDPKLKIFIGDPPNAVSNKHVLRRERERAST